MQKKPSYSSCPTAVSLILLAATMPFNISSAQSGNPGSNKSSLAQREIIRRTQAVVEADRLFNEGREAYAKGDFQKAVDNYKQALGNVKDVPALVDRHQSYTQHLADASVALAQQHRKVGKYDEARQLLEGVLSPDVDPDNAIAKTELSYLEDPIRTNPVLTHDHVKKVDQVRRKLYMAQGYFDLGKYNEAKKEYEDIIRIDPFNEAARRGMEKIASAKSDYYRAAYDHTRVELLMQVDEAWELSVPADVPTVPTDTTGGDRPSDGVAAITDKLRTIIIPRIDFEDRTVEEAIDYLRLRAAELDTTELDPAKKGVNLVIRSPAASSIGGVETEGGGDALLGAAGNLGFLRIDELRLRNVPLAVALKYICDKTKLRYKVDDFAVTLVPITEEGDDMFTRTFRVPPDFVTQLNSGNAEGAAPVDDPFAAAGGAGAANAGLAARPSIIELLKRNGINFADGSAATLGGSGSLLVTNTAAELDKVEQLVDLYQGQQPKQVKISTKFVEITQENSDELGFDWVFSPIGGSGGNIFGTAGTLGNGAARTAADFVNPVDGTLIPGIPTTPSANVSNTSTSGLRSGDYAINRNSIDSILNNPNRTAQNPKVAPGILGVTGLFSDGQIQMIMRGLAQKKGSDLMTAPSVTARSGQTAKIEVIREFIYPTEYEPPEIPQNIGGGGGINNNNNGGGVPANIPVTPATPTSWETRNTGVTLEIEPTIGENDFVIDVRFLPEIVEFEGFVNYGSPVLAPSVDADGNPLTLVVTENRIEMPVFSKRSVNTSLAIYDGYTVAVGGLMREDVQIVEDRVPILGDIPVIGRLFQSEAENRIKSNLIIFVTAEIIDATGKRLRGEESSNVPMETIENVSPLTPDGSVLPPIQGDGLPIE